jgi:hypothetical protein
MKTNPRGVYEKVVGSGVWWVQHFDANGARHREKAGSKSAAINLYNKRKTQAQEGQKLPDMRRHAVLFSEIAADAENYIREQYSRPADEIARLRVIKEWFAGKAADRITPTLIRSKLTEGARKNRWAPSTRNHFHNLICLCYRIAMEEEKVKESPIHDKVAKLKEDNDRVRFLTAEEETRLRGGPPRKFTMGGARAGA